jgi:hypothetical protein
VASTHKIDPPCSRTYPAHPALAPSSGAAYGLPFPSYLDHLAGVLPPNSLWTSNDMSVRGGGNAMGGYTFKAQHYHDLAFECLVLAKITTNIATRENYHNVGQYYLAKALAELTLAKQEAVHDRS